MKIILKKSLRLWGDPNRYEPNGKLPTLATLKSAYKRNPKLIKDHVENWKELLEPKPKKIKKEDETKID